MKKLLSFATLWVALSLHAQQPVDYINPLIGTSNFGATHPGAIAPRGYA